MATTTNYGWGTPDDTDLVKDGALAIRDLGQDIDTTTKNLNPETTTGDIAYRSATANTNTRLALGTAGQILTVNSGATAPEWATPATPASGDFVRITTTDSGGSVASFSVNDVFSASYRNYKVLVNYTGAAEAQLLLRFRIGGSDNTTGSSYITQILGPDGASVNASRATQDKGFVGIFNSNLQSQLELNLYNPYLTIPTNYTSVGTGGSALVRYCAGIHNQSTSYTGFTLIGDGQNINITKISVYGIKES